MGKALACQVRSGVSSHWTLVGFDVGQVGIEVVSEWRELGRSRFALVHRDSDTVDQVFGWEGSLALRQTWRTTKQGFRINDRSVHVMRLVKDTESTVGTEFNKVSSLYHNLSESLNWTAGWVKRNDPWPVNVSEIERL